MAEVAARSWRVGTIEQVDASGVALEGPPLFACSRAATRHINRSGGPLRLAAGRSMVISEAWAKEWALKSLSAARTDQYGVEDGCGKVGGRLRMVICPGRRLCVQRPNPHFSSG